MKKYLYILLLLFTIGTKTNEAQDVQYTQLYASSIYLNPAFAGANVCSRVTLTYRNQWPGITTAYKSSMLSIDHYFVGSKVGLGLIVSQDVSGTGVLTTNCLSPIFAYQVGINRKLSFRFGLQPGVTSKSINVSRTVFGDQIIRGGGVPTIEALPQSKTFFDASVGMLVYSTKLWGGLSIFHFNKPNESLIGTVRTKLPVKYCVQGGYRFNLDEDMKQGKRSYSQNNLTIAFNYKHQAKFDQFDVGVYLKEMNILFGLWYRGLPVLKAYRPGYSNNDAIALIVGLEMPRVNFGYSYDITISKLITRTKGAHELTLSYQFCKLKKKKRKAVFVSCPKF